MNGEGLTDKVLYIQRMCSRKIFGNMKIHFMQQNIVQMKSICQVLLILVTGLANKKEFILNIDF